MERQKASIGRAVHFHTSSQSEKPEHATVVDVKTNDNGEEIVNLDVVNHEGVHRGVLDVKYNERGHGWRWPPRV